VRFLQKNTKKYQFFTIFLSQMRPKPTNMRQIKKPNQTQNFIRRGLVAGKANPNPVHSLHKKYQSFESLPRAFRRANAPGIHF
jgi:hypothetical protein